MKVAILIYEGVYLLDFCGPQEIFFDTTTLDSKKAFDVYLVAPTWYGATDYLQKKYPQIEVHTSERIIDNGKIITTAGVSAGIDGALYVVAKVINREVAKKTAQYIEYSWNPI